MKIKIECQGRIREIEAEESKTVLEILKENEILIPASCGGHGTCGKCRIRCADANEESSEEKLVFTSQERKQRLRLACKVFPREGSLIQLLQEESEFEVLAEYKSNQKSQCKSERNKINEANANEYTAAIDIGTTTIAGILLAESTELALASESRINHQRIYGADVISRIHASNTGKREILQECIRKDLREIIEKLIKEAEIEELKTIVLAGNTTMIHLLMGYSCEMLGRFPFVPVNLEPIHGNCRELLEFAEWNSDVFILPGLSAFVGGDITAGLIVTDFLKSDSMNLLIDLGTNGEMAVGNRNHIWVTSAAAGPAFEGGNITFGTGSIKGAVCHAKWTSSDMKLDTIGNVLPITGICGTGALELLSELLEAGIVDKTGLMNERYFKEGYPLGTGKSGEEIRFMQKDVRELQLAKAAIHAGIETLMNESGVTFDQIDTVYLAGGFGYQLNVDKAIRIGLLPKEFMGKVKTVGNSSLYGAALYAKQEEKREQARSLLEISEEIVLSKTEIFQKKYVESMYFI